MPGTGPNNGSLLKIESSIYVITSLFVWSRVMWERKKPTILEHFYTAFKKTISEYHKLSQNIVKRFRLEKYFPTSGYNSSA